MDCVPIPPHAVGRIGMVAQLQRVRPDQVGKLVLVRFPVGSMSSLAACAKPVFAWQVMALGEPVEASTRSLRNIIVADRCLKPVCQLDPAEGDALAIRQAEQEAGEALADLRRILDAHPLTPEDLDAFVDKAAGQFSMQRLLEGVPVAVALKELGFRPMGSGDDAGWQWSGVHLGSELHVLAGPDLFGRWMLVGRNHSQRQAMSDERMLSDVEPRGKVVSLVLDLWRNAFGRGAPVPGDFQDALAYEQHLRDMRSLKIGRPALHADGEVLRAIRRWLLQRAGRNSDEDGLEPDEAMSLAFDNGALRLRARGQAYGCPADGVWVDDCEVSLREFLAIPVGQFRGRRIVVERSEQLLAINSHPLRILHTIP